MNFPGVMGIELLLYATRPSEQAPLTAEPDCSPATPRRLLGVTGMSSDTKGLVPNGPHAPRSMNLASVAVATAAILRSTSGGIGESTVRPINASPPMVSRET